VKYTFFLIALLYTSIIVSQEFKIGKIKKKHFDINLNSEQKAAPAVYLNKYRRTYFKYRKDLGIWILCTTIHDVIKVNSLSGVSYSTKKITVYKDDLQSEKVDKVEAYSYNNIDGKISRAKTEAEGIIINDINSNIEEVSITIPNVKQGTIIEYKYEIESTYWEIDDIIFQENIPVKNIFAKIEVPQFFDYNKFIKGYLPINSKLYLKDRNSSFLVVENEPYISLNAKIYNEIQYQEVISEYSLKDVPALTQEDFVNNIENYRSSVVYELATVEFPVGKKQNRAKTWEEVVQYLNDDERIGGQIQRSNFLNKKADELKRKATSDIDRITIAYNYIQEKMTWDKNKNTYRLQDIHNAYKNNIGTAYEINVLLVVLLKRMGFKAAPVMASTKEHGIPLYPTVDGFDYAIAAVYINDEWMLMDATDENLYLGLLPERVMNWEGRLIEENGESLAISLFSKEYSKNKSIMTAELNSRGEISGQCRQLFSNSEGYYIRRTFKDETSDQREEILKDIINQNDLKDIVFDLDDVTKPVVISFNFDTPHFAERIENKMYLSPQLFLIKSENPFKSLNRVLPIDFRYPRTVENTITITIPDNYKIESIPDALDIKLSGKLGSYRIVFKQVNEKSIQIFSSFKSNSTLVEAEAYNEIKNFYQQIITKEKEKVVLIKK